MSIVAQPRDRQEEKIFIEYLLNNQKNLKKMPFVARPQTDRKNIHKMEYLSEILYFYLKQQPKNSLFILITCICIDVQKNAAQSNVKGSNIDHIFFIKALNYLYPKPFSMINLIWLISLN